MNEPANESPFYKYFAELPLNLKILTGTREKLFPMVSKRTLLLEQTKIALKMFLSEIEETKTRIWGGLSQPFLAGTY